jgi:TPP-dependent pyruvate/acetoin dehydrogenase alpha subunit
VIKKQSGTRMGTKAPRARGRPVSAPPEPLLSRLQQLELYYWMKLTRAVDDQLGMLYRPGKLAGGCYSSLGQEATACASAYALGPGDYVGPTPRAC